MTSGGYLVVGLALVLLGVSGAALAAGFQKVTHVFKQRHPRRFAAFVGCVSVAGVGLVTASIAFQYWVQ